MMNVSLARFSTRGLTALLIASSIACSRSGDTSRTATAPAQQTAAGGPAEVDTVRVVEQPLDVQLSLPAELSPFQAVAIFPKVTGFVSAIVVDRGSTVRAGQQLLTIEAPELTAQRAEAESKLQAAQAQVAAARAKADADRATFERLKAASATPGVVAGIDVQVAEKAADASRSQAASAEQAADAAQHAVAGVRDLESYLRVVAPFAGVITERNVHPGALVGPSASGGTPLLRIMDNRRLRLVVPVPEAYTTEIVEGAEIPFTVAAYPGHTFTGRVARISHAVDVDTRTMAVELDVDNKDGRLAPGAFCQVRWPVHRRGPSLFVPSGSIGSTTDRTFVVRVRDGRTEWVDVRTGLTSGPLVEVFGDLKTGDEIAARGTDELRPGTSVKTKPKVDKPAT